MERIVRGQSSSNNRDDGRNSSDAHPAKAHEKGSPEQVGDHTDDKELDEGLVGGGRMELGVGDNQVHGVANGHAETVAGNSPDPERRIIATAMKLYLCRERCL